MWRDVLSTRSTRKFFAPFGLLALFAVGPVLQGCGEVRSALGYEKQAPDEFAVVARAPLSVPPNFELRAPTPGAGRPQEPSKRDGARHLLVKTPRATGSSQASGTQGEGSLRRLLGTDKAEPGIRDIVNRETAAYVYEDEAFIDRLLFWKDKPTAGVVVDPEKEKKRIQENTALGKDVTEGETPTIKRKRGGLLDGLFK